MFSGAVDEGLSPQEFIDKMREFSFLYISRIIQLTPQKLSVEPRFFFFVYCASAAMFSGAVDEGVSPQEFIDKMRESLSPLYIAFGNIFHIGLTLNRIYIYGLTLSIYMSIYPYMHTCIWVSINLIDIYIHIQIDRYI